LLIDAYGTIEPVDADAMEGVFKLLQNNSSVSLQGSHWAALINAYGCVKKDLDKAIRIFDSIPSPDAVAYESLINVFVTNKQMALAPAYMEKLKSSGVHMTAYIANLLIKGYAAIGDIEEARRIFESLIDPPSGIAASGNHVPHEGSQQSVSPSPSPSYREVSIGALIHGNDSPCLSSRRRGKLCSVQSLVMVIATGRLPYWCGYRKGMHIYFLWLARMVIEAYFIKAIPCRCVQSDTRNHDR